jgi:very-short-patch-repair endonuclease
MEEILELAEGQHGLVATHQLRELGLRAGTTQALVRSSGWCRLSATVFRRRGAPTSRAQLVLAAVLDCGRGANLSHSSGSALWGYRGAHLRLPVDVSRTSRTRARSEMATIHTVRALPARWTTVLEGIPVVRPELVALHLHATMHPRKAERITDSMWSQRLLSGRSVAELLADLGRRGRNGTAGLRRYLEERGEDYVPPASNVESRVAQLLGDAGVPLRRQVDSGNEDWSGRVDFRHESLPLVVEVQSELHHTALSNRDDDAARRLRLEAAGFTVVEVWDDAVWTRPNEVVASVRAAIAAMPASPARSVLRGQS